MSETMNGRADESAACFIARQQSIYPWAVGGVIFGVTGIASAVSAWSNVDASFPFPRAIAVVTGAIWGLMALWCVFESIRSLHVRLVICRSHVEKTAGRSSARIVLEDVTNVCWRRSGTVTVCSHNCELSIALPRYGRKSQRVIVRFLRSRIPLELHSGWDTCRRFHWIAQPTSIEVIRSRLRVSVGVLALICVACLGVALWMPKAHTVTRVGVATNALGILASLEALYQRRCVMAWLGLALFCSMLLTWFVVSQ